MSGSSIRNYKLDSFLTNYELKVSATDEAKLLMSIWFAEAGIWVNAPEMPVVWVFCPRHHFASTDLLLWGCATCSCRCNLSLLSQNFVFLQSIWFSEFKDIFPYSPGHLRSEPQRNLENTKEHRYIIERDKKSPARVDFFLFIQNTNFMIGLLWSASKNYVVCKVRDNGTNVCCMASVSLDFEGY